MLHRPAYERFLHGHGDEPCPNGEEPGLDENGVQLGGCDQCLSQVIWEIVCLGCGWRSGMIDGRNRRQRDNALAAFDRHQARAEAA